MPSDTKSTIASYRRVLKHGELYTVCLVDEVLDGDNRYACDSCRQRCRATRSTRFEVAPNTLVLCLKRFGTGRFGKINKVVTYGEQLDLGPFMAEGAMDDKEVNYTLSGVIVHLDQVRPADQLLSVTHCCRRLMLL